MVNGALRFFLPLAFVVTGFRRFVWVVFWSWMACYCDLFDLLVFSFPLQANDEFKTNDAPEVSCFWVSNHGSSGFTVEFDVFKPSNSPRDFDWMKLLQNRLGFGRIFSDSGTLVSCKQDWLSIPGFDGETPLPYSGYLHSIEFKITGEIKQWCPPVLCCGCYCRRGYFSLRRFE